ncbi:acyl-CoA dehydrogenase family protein [Corynebacterium guangdongense]|uniref:Cyclohexanecarboxyl-CoA dehydrogenase n=1 Tax=Corynebacterium guangdongense TaxID=1783348 RepID=A0ABU1ZTW7_9CORY|nr:acyl-CoA dehydrogenase family protein [Corynebacterium guangdongense]MDR7328381.1 cyclohexanecarboxyl-CoA dehydrogenase [Corynebacterium guangdongense]WJZ16958.1 Acryloyl-CoA reductase (NADH) [Corynebacterium guangdongense]
MDFTINPTTQALVDDARAFAEEIMPTAQQREDERIIRTELRQEMGRRGFIAPELPKELGGQGLDALTSGMVIEEISRADINVSYVQVVGSLVAQVIVRNAVDEIKNTWVPKIASGDDIVAIGLSEPEGGSDAGNPRTTAHKDGDEWVINGKKSMSFAMHAGATVIFARTSEDRRGKGISAFIVELDRDGVSRTPTNDMGTLAVGRGFVTFDNVRVPEINLLGEEGAAFTQVMQGFDFSRALIGLQVIGAAQQTLDETWKYTSERIAFDQPISKFQGVSFPLAEADTLLTAARVLCQKTLWSKDAGRDHTREAAMCKWWAPKTAYDVINQCLLSHGQFGYLRDLPVEKRLRDVLGLQIGDGTAQIMKLIIARQNLGRQAAP